MAVLARRALYRNFLTPCLHRRFARAAALVLLICYAEAIIIGDKSHLFWLWFPVGFAGLRTGLLFISALSIFVLRVAQLHIGQRTTPSPFHTFRQYLFRFDTVQTLLWYSFSAWWFSEVYVWSAPDNSNLNWVTEGKSYERPRLNERPIYLRCIFLVLAVLQSGLHLYYDYDRVLIPTVKPKPSSATEQNATALTPPLTQIRSALPKLAQTSVFRALIVVMLGPIIYPLFMRQTAWNSTLLIAKVLWALPKSSSPPKIPPYHISLLWRSLVSGSLLMFLWAISNAIFSAYVAQEPLKKGRPLTDESKDPNGSLLNGLKAKREIPKTFAFWELLYISERAGPRRKSFFEDIDRAGGPTWTQIMTACLTTIESINIRITEFSKPPPTSASANPPPPSEGTNNNPQPLPRISTIPVKDEEVLTSSPKPSSRRAKAQAYANDFVKARGQQNLSSPNKQGFYASPLSSPHAKRLLEYGTNHMLSAEQKEALSQQGITSTVHAYMLQFLRSPAGRPFRQTRTRRLTAIILGPSSSYSSASSAAAAAAPSVPAMPSCLIVDAITALTHLAIASLADDPFGNVARDIPTLVRVFGATISSLETFSATLPAHWTDVRVPSRDTTHAGATRAGTAAQGEKKPEEEEEEDVARLLLTTLKRSLGDLLGAFAEYADHLGLSAKEVRIARELCVVSPPPSTSDAPEAASGTAGTSKDLEGRRKSSEIGRAEEKNRPMEQRRRQEQQQEMRQVASSAGGGGGGGR
ncbi:MAG: hypothetical protein M1819_006554 [Sarea resinae]|nr:MAG: hypothetical protein M1819_006554 [Sarea resinae]